MGKRKNKIKQKILGIIFVILIILLDQFSANMS